VDLGGQRGVLARFFEDFLRSFTEGVVDVVVEFAQLNTVTR
jgi:hypothetical protein